MAWRAMTWAAVIKKSHPINAWKNKQGRRHCVALAQSIHGDLHGTAPIQRGSDGEGFRQINFFINYQVSEPETILPYGH